MVSFSFLNTKSMVYLPWNFNEKNVETKLDRINFKIIAQFMLFQINGSFFFLSFSDPKKSFASNTEKIGKKSSRQFEKSHSGQRDIIRIW
jgi:hypothetical protein